MNMGIQNIVAMVPLNALNSFVSWESFIPGTYIIQLFNWSSMVFFHGRRDHFSPESITSSMPVNLFSIVSKCVTINMDIIDLTTITSHT